MTQMFNARMTAQIEGDFVVFLIGMRINVWWKIWAWLPVVTAMPKMLIELFKRPELGLLSARTHFNFPNVMVVQYWRSFDQLHTYATNKTFAHLPAWKAFNKAVGTSGDVGIWHETFLVPAGGYECVYNNMPRYGLALAGEHVPATGRRTSAAGRLQKTDGQDHPKDLT